MVIKLDESILEEKTFSKNVISALDNIAFSMREGNHIVFASKKVLSNIIKRKELEKKSLVTFNYILRHRNGISAAQKYVEAYILVVKGNGKVERDEDNEKKIIYKVPIENFKTYNKLSPALLVGEDESDCDLYKAICNKYIKENNIGVNIQLGEINGGGGKTGINYEKHLVQYNEKLLVIVDSDKKHVNDDIGTTAREVRKRYDSCKRNYITDIYILKVREKENLISSKMYKFCSQSLNSKNDLRLLNYIENNPILKNLYYYCDIKDGIKYKELFQDSKNYNILEEYLKEKIRIGKFNRLIGILDKLDMKELSEMLKQLFYSEEECAATEEISCTEDNEDNKKDKRKVTKNIGYLIDDFIKEILYEGLNQKIESKKRCTDKNDALIRDIKSLEKKQKYIEDLFDYLPNELREEWENISRKLITWGCSADYEIS